jgi:hypothetical protein
MTLKFGQYIGIDHGLFAARSGQDIEQEETELTEEMLFSPAQSPLPRYSSC